MISPVRRKGWIAGVLSHSAIAVFALTSVLVFADVAAPTAQAQSFTVLHSFTGGTDGSYPGASLTMDAKGDLYGTTGNGGAGACSAGHPGCGTVFQIDTTGTETVLFGFPGKFGRNGESPDAAVVRDLATGDLYGVSADGGGTSHYGVVFRVQPNGHQTVLHSFAGGSDGAYPNSLVRDSSGNLYGTTSAGGGTGCGGGGCGTVFLLTASGKETVLYRFAGGSDGIGPNSLIRDSAGNLYGTTSFGGSSQYFGTVFTVNKFGTESVLYSFTGGTDGANPAATLLLDKTGEFYGTTYTGGAYNFGTVFKLNKFGNEAVLYSFTGGADGAYPAAGLVRDSAGNFYGTTVWGGASSDGVVFKLDSTGTETILHTFAGYPTDGAAPNGLIRDAAGNLYGTTYQGGGTACFEGRGCGIVFKLTP